jgi:hypothetical protein
MPVNVNVTLTVPLETFVAVRDAPYPELNHELVNRVASATTYTIIDGLKGHSYDIDLRSNATLNINHGRPIKILIMKLSDGKYLPCKVMNNASARELACLIHDQYGMPLLKQILMFHGMIIFRRDYNESIDISLEQVGWPSWFGASASSFH